MSARPYTRIALGGREMVACPLCQCPAELWRLDDDDGSQKFVGCCSDTQCTLAAPLKEHFHTSDDAANTLWNCFATATAQSLDRQAEVNRVEEELQAGNDLALHAAQLLEALKGARVFIASERTIFLQTHTNEEDGSLDWEGVEGQKDFDAALAPIDAALAKAVPA